MPRIKLRSSERADECSELLNHLSSLNQNCCTLCPLLKSPTIRCFHLLPPFLLSNLLSIKKKTISFIHTTVSPKSNKDSLIYKTTNQTLYHETTKQSVSPHFLLTSLLPYLISGLKRFGNLPSIVGSLSHLKPLNYINQSSIFLLYVKNSAAFTFLSSSLQAFSYFWFFKVSCGGSCTNRGSEGMLLQVLGNHVMI